MSQLPPPVYRAAVPPPPLATLAYDPPDPSSGLLKPAIWMAMASPAAPLLGDAISLVWMLAGLVPGAATSAVTFGQRGIVLLMLSLVRLSAGIAVVAAGAAALRTRRVTTLAICCVALSGVTLAGAVINSAYQWTLYYNRNTPSSYPYNRILINGLVTGVAYAIAPAVAAIALNTLRGRTSYATRVRPDEMPML